MVRVQNVLCSFFVCQILYEKRRCFGISSNVHQINEEIRDSEIRLISATGEQLGIMSAAQAQHIADEQGLDLVEDLAAGQAACVQAHGLRQVPL